MLEQISITNFKAIARCNIRLSDLAVFIGNNGSGKSSVLDALHTLQTVLLHGVSKGFQLRWLGLEHIRHNQSRYQHNRSTKAGIPRKYADMEFRLKGRLDDKMYEYAVSFNTSLNEDMYWVMQETLKISGRKEFESVLVNTRGERQVKVKNQRMEYRSDKLFLAEGPSDEVRKFYEYLTSWQFLTLNPERMYYPTPQHRGVLPVRLEESGQNIASYFSKIADYPEQLNQLIQKMMYVLPDLSDLQVEATMEIQKQLYLRMQEKNEQPPLPSWLFSSGTLRILALLLVLNHPQRSPVILIEEIENGLDPRTLNLLVEDIRGILPESQCIVTTHSPYFLDLVDLRHIVVAERQDGNTTYYRPNDDERLHAWKEKFSVGSLYTMNRLTRV